MKQTFDELIEYEIANAKEKMTEGRFECIGYLKALMKECKSVLSDLEKTKPEDPCGSSRMYIWIKSDSESFIKANQKWYEGTMELYKLQRIEKAVKNEREKA